MLTETLSTLKINKLSQEQYDRELANGSIDENAIYLTPDADLDLGEVEQTLKEQGNEIEVVKGDLTSHTNSSNAQFALVREEIANADSETLKSAKEYSDSNKNSAIGEAKAYTDQEIEKLVTDTEFEGVLSTIQDIQNAMATDEELAQALETANGKKVDKGAKGSAIQPIYFDDNGAQPITYTIEKSVPADAKFTDTTYTLIKDSTNKKIQLMNGDTLVSEVDDNNTTYGVATQENSGLMTKEDKIKLDGINEEIDDKLSFDEEVINSASDVAKIVPEGSGKYAAVNKVGGMSYKSRNLLNVTATTQTINGVTFTVNADKSITISGTATARASFPLTNAIANTFINYILYGCPNGSANTYYFYIDYYKQDGTWATFIGGAYGAGTRLTVNQPKCWFNLVVVEGATVNTTIYPMILEATETNTSYEPYYSGLRNAYVSKITSESKNICNFFNSNDAFGIYYTKNTDGSLTLSGTATGEGAVGAIWRAELPIGVPLTISGGIDSWVYNKNGEYIGNWNDGRPTITLKEGDYVTLFLKYVTVGEIVNKTVYPQIEIGTEATEYTPYKDIEPFTIPIGARGVGYGMGINESCYNYIDFERKVYVQRCAKINLGSLTWHEQEGHKGIFHAQIEGMSQKWAKGVCSCYSFSDEVFTWLMANTCLDKTAYRADNDWIYIKDLSFADTTAFKAAMTGEYFVYELATPIETDISDYIQDNFIEVAAGGVISAVNEYNYNVPTEYEFYTSENPEKVMVGDTFIGEFIGNAKIKELNVNHMIIGEGCNLVYDTINKCVSFQFL